ncbi:MAG TPA: hypothetical protein VFO16_07625 [Pseudonocardiaceae bacterium]|nr:hypothetical protein [Pseudonocardiaceae bacterium]
MTPADRTQPRHDNPRSTPHPLFSTLNNMRPAAPAHTDTPMLCAQVSAVVPRSLRGRPSQLKGALRRR